MNSLSVTSRKDGGGGDSLLRLGDMANTGMSATLPLGEHARNRKTTRGKGDKAEALPLGPAVSNHEITRGEGGECKAEAGALSSSCASPSISPLRADSEEPPESLLTQSEGFKLDGLSLESGLWPRLDEQESHKKMEKTKPKVKVNRIRKWLGKISAKTFKHAENAGERVETDFDPASEHSCPCRRDTVPCEIIRKTDYLYQGKVYSKAEHRCLLADLSDRTPGCLHYSGEIAPEVKEGWENGLDSNLRFSSEVFARWAESKGISYDDRLELLRRMESLLRWQDTLRIGAEDAENTTRKYNWAIYWVSEALKEETLFTKKAESSIKEKIQARAGPLVANKVESLNEVANPKTGAFFTGSVSSCWHELFTSASAYSEKMGVDELTDRTLQWGVLTSTGHVPMRLANERKNTAAEMKGVEEVRAAPRLDLIKQVSIDVPKAGRGSGGGGSGEQQKESVKIKRRADSLTARAKELAKEMKGDADRIRGFFAAGYINRKWACAVARYLKKDGKWMPNTEGERKVLGSHGVGQGKKDEIRGRGRATVNLVHLWATADVGELVEKEFSKDHTDHLKSDIDGEEDAKLHANYAVKCFATSGLLPAVHKAEVCIYCLLNDAGIKVDVDGYIREEDKENVCEERKSYNVFEKMGVLARGDSARYLSECAKAHNREQHSTNGNIEFTIEGNADRCNTFLAAGKQSWGCPTVLIKPVEGEDEKCRRADSIIDRTTMSNNTEESMYAHANNGTAWHYLCPESLREETVTRLYQEWLARYVTEGLTVMHSTIEEGAPGGISTPRGADDTARGYDQLLESGRYELVGVYSSSALDTHLRTSPRMATDSSVHAYAIRFVEMDKARILDAQNGSIINSDGTGYEFPSNIRQALEAEGWCALVKDHLVHLSAGAEVGLDVTASRPSEGAEEEANPERYYGIGVSSKKEHGKLALTTKGQAFLDQSSTETAEGFSTNRRNKDLVPTRIQGCYTLNNGLCRSLATTRADWRPFGLKASIIDALKEKEVGWPTGQEWAVIERKVPDSQWEIVYREFEGVVVTPAYIEACYRKGDKLEVARGPGNESGSEYWYLDDASIAVIGIGDDVVERDIATALSTLGRLPFPMVRTYDTYNVHRLGIAAPRREVFCRNAGSIVTPEKVTKLVYVVPDEWTQMVGIEGKEVPLPIVGPNSEIKQRAFTWDATEVVKKMIGRLLQHRRSIKEEMDLLLSTKYKMQPDWGEVAMLCSVAMTRFPVKMHAENAATARQNSSVRPNMSSTLRAVPLEVGRTLANTLDGIVSSRDENRDYGHRSAVSAFSQITVPTHRAACQFPGAVIGLWSNMAELACIMELAFYCVFNSEEVRTIKMGIHSSTADKVQRASLIRRGYEEWALAGGLRDAVINPRLSGKYTSVVSHSIGGENGFLAAEEQNSTLRQCANMLIGRSTVAWSWQMNMTEDTPVPSVLYRLSPDLYRNSMNVEHRAVRWAEVGYLRCTVQTSPLAGMLYDKSEGCSDNVLIDRLLMHVDGVRACDKICMYDKMSREVKYGSSMLLSSTLCAELADNAGWKCFISRGRKTWGWGFLQRYKDFTAEAYYTIALESELGAALSGHDEHRWLWMAVGYAGVIAPENTTSMLFTSEGFRLPASVTDGGGTAGREASDRKGGQDPQLDTPEPGMSSDANAPTKRLMEEAARKVIIEDRIPALQEPLPQPASQEGSSRMDGGTNLAAERGSQRSTLKPGALAKEGTVGLDRTARTDVT
uniref:RNA-directed RNA polymerase n=2 Tax=unclassified Totiviridae TaxID=39756 RepID=A0AAU7L0N2_9VIRU